MISQKDNLVLPKGESWKMFNRISKKYDFLNRLLSFGYDLNWRNQLCQYVPDYLDLKLLDLATGTADVILTLMKNCPQIKHACGIDLADKMLEIGQEKIEKAGLKKEIELRNGDANEIPYAEESFNIVTISFGIRNVEDPVIVMKEMYRVLKRNGRALILEFSLPQNLIWRHCHLFYLKVVVPLIGGLVSGNGKAYRYLNQTIEQFPYGTKFCKLLTSVGFLHVEAHPLLGGIATIYKADKV